MQKKKKKAQLYPKIQLGKRQRIDNIKLEVSRRQCKIVQKR